jgi:hypothetical protein
MQQVVTMLVPGGLPAVRAIGSGVRVLVIKSIGGRRWESDIVMRVGMAVRQAYDISLHTMQVCRADSFWEAVGSHNSRGRRIVSGGIEVHHPRCVQRVS